MFTWPDVLLWFMAAALGVGSSLALGRLIKNKLHERQATADELEEDRRRQLQEGLDASRRS